MPRRGKILTHFTFANYEVLGLKKAEFTLEFLFGLEIRFAQKLWQNL